MYNPFKVLGVTSKTPIQDIKKEYRRLSRIYHPDNLDTGNADKFKEICDAWTAIEKGNYSIPLVTNNKVKKTYCHKTIFTIKEV